MNHLTFDEIIEYVSMSKLNEEALMLASKVDTHIRDCDECLELVRAVRAIYEEFVRMKKEKSFTDFLKKPVAVDDKTKARLEEIQTAFKSFEK